MHEIHFSAGALPRTPLGELTTQPFPHTPHHPFALFSQVLDLALNPATSEGLEKPLTLTHKHPKTAITLMCDND